MRRAVKIGSQETRVLIKIIKECGLWRGKMYSVTIKIVLPIGKGSIALIEGYAPLMAIFAHSID